MREPEERERLAGVLRELSAAVRDYGRLATHHDRIGRELAESDLRERLDAARTSRTGSAWCWPPTRRSGRWAGRCAASWSAILTGSAAS